MFNNLNETLQTKPKCYISHHKWTNSLSLTVYYEHFMLVGYIYVSSVINIFDTSLRTNFIFADKGGTGWEIHELEQPGEGDIEIPFEAAKILSVLISDNPLTGNEEEELKKDKWCFVTYPTPLGGPWEWISGLMPYEAYLNAREAGCYQTDCFVAIFDGYEETKNIYKEIIEQP